MAAARRVLMERYSDQFTAHDFTLCGQMNLISLAEKLRGDKDSYIFVPNSMVAARIFAF